MAAPLNFTPELIAAARARPEATRPLIHRWALFSGQGRDLARDQLEQAARLVPPEKRGRALRRGRSADSRYSRSGPWALDLHHPPLDFEIGACFAYSPDAFWFDDRPAVRAALDDKLKKYPFPLVVALQGIETGDLFLAAEEELLGGEVINIPISMVTGGPAGPARPGRSRDSSLHRRGSDGDRVRERLEALLPFEAIVTERGFVVRARLLANPAKPHLPSLEEFRPIPSLLRAGPGEMAYRDQDGTPTSRSELNDQFVV